MKNILSKIIPAFALSMATLLLCAGCIKDLDYCYLDVKSDNETMGTASGSGSYERGTQVDIRATAKSGYQFTRWSDGSTERSRKVTVTEDAEYIAYFMKPGSNGSGSVRFGNYVWSVVYPELRYSGGRIFGYIYSDNYSGNHQFPVIMLNFRAQQEGTVSYTSQESSGGFLLLDEGETVVDYYEDESIGSGQNYYGDWWAKSASITISRLDLNSMEASIKINATLFDAEAAYVGDDAVGHDNAEQRNLVIQLNNISIL